MAALSELKRLFTYCYRILKESRAAGDLLFDIRGDGARFVDMALFFDEEPLVGFEGRSLAIRRSLVEGRVSGRPPEEDKAIRGGFDKLLHLYDLLLNNPYELDLVYAYLFAVGIDGSGGAISAPLYLAPASLTYDESDGALRLECVSDEARVNLYGLAALVPDAEQLIIDGLNTSPYLHLPATLKEINAHLNRLVELQSAIQVKPMESSALASAFETWKPDLPKGRYALRRTAALAMVRRGNVYLLRDLERLQNAPDDQLRESVVARFALGDEADAGSGDTLAGAADDLILPFPASEAQRRIARLALKHRMILVQGPPGTGKSHTISNLACHLVAQGKSVLVTSQKNKALEVVDQKLRSLELGDLQVTLLKDDKESKKKVKQIVEEQITRYSGMDRRRFERAAEQAASELQAEKAALDRLAKEFAESRRYETRRVPGPDLAHGQLWAEFAGLRGFDLVAAADSVPWDAQERVRSALSRAVGIHLSLGTGLVEAERFAAESPPPLNQIDALLSDLRQVESHLAVELEAGSRADLNAFLARHAEFKLDDAAALAEKEAEIRRVASEIEELHQGAARMLDPETGKALYLSLLKEFATGLTEQAAADIRKLQTAVHELKQIESLESQSRDLNLEGIEKERLRDILMTYRDKKGSFFRWLSGDFKAARREILKICRATTPHVGYEQEQLLEARLKAEDMAHALIRRLRDELSHLKLPERPAFCKPAEAAAFRSSLEQRQRLLEILSELNFIEDQLRGLGFPNIQLDRIGDAAYFRETHALLQRMSKGLQAVIGRLKSDSLLSRWKCGPSFKAAGEAWRAADLDGFRSARLELERLAGLYRKLSGLAEIEAGCPELRHTFSALREDSRRGGRLAETIQTELGRVLRAAAVRTLLRRLDETAPRTTGEVAAEVRACEDRVLRSMARSAKARLDLLRASNLTLKAVNNTVSHFAKVLQRSAKNYKAFEELKTETDFSALLKVLPCWICGIGDVSRIFPLQDGLFDYAVVDEASQCFLPSSIPILYRARHVIVVGDDQQLPNAEASYVAKDLSKALMTELALKTLPRSGSFDATENSLYDLIFSFKDRSVFLDEHFRCNPEIIRFSNGRFYNGRLKIATESMSRSLGPSLELVRVADGSDDPESGVNRREAEALVERLGAMFAEPRYEGQSFGVCSLFREQADFLAELISKRIPISERLKRQIIATTADGFQGDERDVILFSFRFSTGSSRNLFSFMQTADGQKRANVAFTRARKQVLCFVSAPIEEFPQGVVRDYLQYVQDPGSTAPDTRPWKSDFESAVQAALESQGLKILPRYSACGFRIDLVAWDGKSKPVAIELDGWEYHADDDGQMREEDVYRQSFLERAGWKVVRVTAREFFRAGIIPVKHRLFVISGV
jgi:very-short-patch-repair endonuclease